MVEPSPIAGRPNQVRRSFPTTHWSLIRAAGGTESPETAAALETLCRIYWHPVYAYIRRWGRNPEDARDLTQDFFAQLLEKKVIGRADPSRGRFRSFILGLLKYFLRHEHRNAQAKKRGGDYRIVSWDQKVAESRLGYSGVDDESPDRIFERRWAQTVLEHAAAQLREEYQTSGRESLFEALRPLVMLGEEELSYTSAAAEIGTSIDAAKMAATRLRRRYYRLIREEVVQTLEDPAELDNELRHLFAVFVPS
jgi:RNA polymerase sigma-70 factor (ECF subfamily)